MVTHNALLFLFPGYRDGDWVLQNDGEGSYIAQWNRTEPQPTQEQIEAVTQATDIVSLKAALKARYSAAVSVATASALTEFKRYDK